MLFAVCCVMLLSVVCFGLFVVGCLPFAICCVLFVYSLFVVCCPLFVVCCFVDL